MCHFISWIEKDGEVLFLTANEIFNTKRGRELQGHCKNKYDLVGHGAIRFYFNDFKNGTNKECTDFTTPDNFSPEIVTAIKRGAFRGLGIAFELLVPGFFPEWDKAKAEWDKARAEYKKTRAEHNKVIVEWRKVIAEWDKTKAECDKVKAEINQNEFWNLFSQPENRNPLWR